MGNFASEYQALKKKREDEKDKAASATKSTGATKISSGGFAQQYQALKEKRGEEKTQTGLSLPSMSLPGLHPSTPVGMPATTLPVRAGVSGEQNATTEAEAPPGLSLPGLKDTSARAGGFGGGANEVKTYDQGFTGSRTSGATSLVERIGATLSGATKAYGASVANAETNLYDITQGGRDVMNQEYLEAAKLKYDQALQDYEEIGALAKQYPEDKHWQTELAASRNMLEAAERELAAYGETAEIQRGATEQSYGVADQLAESGQVDVERAKAGLGGLGGFAVDVGVGGAQLAADIGLGAATGGGTMLPLLLRSYGGGAQEARQEGATAQQAAAYGVASAMTEALTEKISSLGNFQTRAFGAGALDDILEGVVGAVERLGKTEMGRALLNRAASAGVGFLSEGAEEFVGSVVSPLLKKAIYSKEPINWKETMEEAAYEFLVGGGIGAISGGVGGTDTSQIQQAFLSGVVEQAQNDAYKAMAENGMFSRSGKNAAREALTKMDTAWERSGVELPAAPGNSGSMETTANVPEIAANVPETGVETHSKPLQESENNITRQLPQESVEQQSNQNGGITDGAKQLTGPATAETGESAGREQAGAVSDGSERWDVSERTGGQAGRVERGAGASAAIKQSGTAIERQNTARSLRLERVSSRSLGIENGTDRPSLRTMPQTAWDSEMQTTADYVRSTSGLETVYVLGGIEVERSSGGISRARGAILPDKSVIIQADHTRLSVTQIADHELYHNLARETPGLNAEVERKILETYGQEEFDRVLETYIQKQMGIIDVTDDMAGAALDEAMDRIKEEIFADAYAGINAFGAGADRFTETVNRAAEDRGGQLSRTYSEATDRTTGPPEGLRLPGVEEKGEEKTRFSIDYDEDNQPFVTVEEDILEGVPREDWARTVKENLRKKFPNGVTVGNSEIQIDKQSRSEMTYSKYTQRLMRTEPELYADKLRATNNADDILRAARDYVNEALLHPRKDNIQDFARGRVQLRVGGNDYTAQVVVAMRSNGKMLLYDVINMEPATIQSKKPDAAITVNPSPGADRSTASDFMDTIPQAGTDVNRGAPEGLRLPGPEDFRDTGTSAGNVPGDNETDVRFSLDEDQEDVTQTEADRQEEKEESRTADQTKRKPVTESRPIIAKQDLRKGLTSLFSIPEGQRAEIGKIVDSYADRLLKNGTLTETDRTDLFDRLYESGVMTVPADQYYQMGLQAVAGGRIFVNDQIRGDFGDDWNDFRKRAFASGVYLTGDKGDAGVDVWNGELAEMLPGLFDGEELDGRTALERIIQVAEEGRDEKMSLPEYTAMTAQQEYVSEDEILNNMERQMDWMLRSFADKANLEVKLRDRTGVKIAQERAKRAEAVQRQKTNREMRDLQNRTLKQLQWLNKNRNKAPADLRAAFDEVLGDIDLFAVSAANEMNWSKKYQATWKDLAEMYQNAKRTDPNFLPSAELERIVTRLSADKIGEMDVSALQDLYKAAVGLRTEYYNRKNVINDERGRLFSQVYDGAKQEIMSAPGGAKASDESYDMGKAEKFLNMEQLTPMNYLERMGGWNPDGDFYSMAKQLEQGERDMRRYKVQAESLLEDFLTKNADWVKRSDGQGKDAIWYEIEVPELLELGMGDKPVFGDNIKVYMTPAQKVHMYLESRNYDNLRHMAGGRTFADKALYAKGKRQEAFAQGKTVRLAPETVKTIVQDLTAEEMEMAKALDSYYNQFAAEQINQKSNILYGYDKAMSGSYAPIYSNQNYVKSEIGIFDTTAEGVGNLKARQYSGNPSYNISALDAFERHMDQTARFVGMAIPARNWQTLLNWREKNNSMGDVITHKWGKESKQYIEDLLTTLQGGGVDGKKTLDGLADTMLSNYVTGVFGANPGIVLKQAASFPQFAAALGWRNLPRAFAKADENLINTYTSELAYRTLGYAMPETAQLKNNPNWMDTNKATRFLFRGGAITAMDAATVKRAWPWAEAKVSREHPELEMGTREQIEAGESPFYKKVAEEFENAVSLTQPMYDEMHRPDIMKNGGSIQRAFTMFKTVPLQQYNTLRRAIGEARQAAMKVKSAEGAEAKRQAQANAKTAAQAAGAAVTATLASTLMLEGIEFLNQLWKNMGKGYRDDDDELTAESVAQQMARNAAGDLTGMVIGGGELTDIIASKLLDETWWGIEIPGGEQINEVIESIQGAADTIETIAGGAVEIVRGGGDLKEYFRRNAGDYAGAAKEIAEKAAMYLGGLPVENIEKYIMGSLQIASPELWEGAQSAFDTPAKGDMAGLDGAALTARAGSVLRTRGLDVEDETAEALAALYKAGYTAAIPSDTPGSVTVNGESRKLNAYQKQTYDMVWSGTLADCMDSLIASGDFQNKNEETQAKILERLYSYAGEKAKEALFDDYEMSSSALQADAVVRAGASPEEWAAWATAPDEDIIASEDKLRKIQELRYSVWGDEVKDTALQGILSEADYNRLQDARKAGISIENWCELYENIANEKIKRTGKSGSPSQADVTNALKGAGLTEKQKDVIWAGYGWKGERP